ncbi:MAG: hypothetical protein ACC661_02575, partial [Verrucomicrobiales bacterium]
GKLLVDYLKRSWPGYGGTLAGKYGRREAVQIALNIINLSHMATNRMRPDPDYFSWDYRNWVTSSNYFADSSAPATLSLPERSYWYLNDDFEVDYSKPPMLPQMPGPHINEIRFVVIPELQMDPEFPDEGKFYLRYRYEVEYYMHPFGPRLGFIELNYEDSQGNPAVWVVGTPFPARIDYLRLEAELEEPELEPDAYIKEFKHPSWNEHQTMKAFIAALPRSEHPIGPTLPDGSSAMNYRVVSSSPLLFTAQRYVLGQGNPPVHNPPVAFDPQKNSSVKLNIRLRLGLSAGIVKAKQMVPLGIGPDDVLEADLEIPLDGFESEYSVSWEVEDPRVSRFADDWMVVPDGEHSMGAMNHHVLGDEWDEFGNAASKFRGIQRADGSTGIGGVPLRRRGEYSLETRFPSTGYLSMIHTGIQSRVPWRTISLSPKDDRVAPADGPPDSVLLDLLGPTYPMPHWRVGRSLPDSWSAVSYMNSTAGKVNLNTKIYPDSDNFRPPPRRKALEGVFRYFRGDQDVEKFVEEIENYQDTNEVFDYIGELTEVEGYAEGSTQWEREALLRNMAGCLSTNSNTFGVWGVAQAVQKSYRNAVPGEFEPGDRVLAEKRFYALVERYIWEGRDGVPGNAHIDGEGLWDRVAEPPAAFSASGEIKKLPGGMPHFSDPDARFAEMDGPDQVEIVQKDAFAELPFAQSSLEDAHNPPHPVTRYRVRYFKFLDQ